jgi:hypothetical protein
MKINSDYPINKDILIDISEMLKDYDFIVSKRFIKDRVKDFLKDSTPKKCRFCGKSFPDVTFNTEAHSIPEFLGNKSLISLFECDSCNKDYFSSFENEFANFMLPHNAMAGTKSKGNKISKYKQKGQSQIIYSTENISLTNVPDSLIKESDNYSLEINVKIPSFIPEYVYRCLVKIGLSIIPEEKLNGYKRTIKWLMNRESKSNLNPFMLFSLYPFNFQTNEIVCAILERKDNSIKDVPHSVFFLSCNNFSFQTCIPYNIKEKIGINLKAIPFIYPMTFDLNQNYEGMKTLNYIDLSSKEKTKDKMVTYIIKGERQHIV